MTIEIKLPFQRTFEDDARHRRILRHATVAFLTHGYAGASIENIAFDAGVSKLTLYRLFAGKLDLATAVMRELADSLEKELRAVDIAAPPEDWLTNFGVAYVRWMSKPLGKTHHFAILRLLVEMSGPHPEVNILWIETTKKISSTTLVEYIRTHFDSNKFAGEDADFIGNQFLSCLYQPIYSVVVNNTVIPDPQEIRRRVRFFLRAGPHCAGRTDLARS